MEKEISVRQARLGELRRGDRGTISSVDGEQLLLAKQLMEMGFLEGAIVEVLHEAPLSGDPIAVRVRGSIVALRRSEANIVKVSVL